MDNVFWELFRKTGDIKYYLLLKNIDKRSDDIENRTNRGNNIK